MSDSTANQPAAEHDVPEKAVRHLRLGAYLAVTFAEAMSSVRLFGLGEQVGFAWYLAWLLPGALDIYALTMLRFSSAVPAGHTLRHKAMREATLALTLTVSCNALYETIRSFAAQLPAWAPGALFVLVSALAPFVAGRIIHFHSTVGSTRDAGATAQAPVSATTPPPQALSALTQTPPASAAAGATEPGTQAPADAASAPSQAPAASVTERKQAPPASATTNGKQRPKSATRVATVTDIASANGMSNQEWAKLAAPVYQELMKRQDGKKVTAPKLLEEVVLRGLAAPVSPARARVIRSETEKLLGLTDDDEDTELELEAV